MQKARKFAITVTHAYVHVKIILQLFSDSSTLSILIL